MKNPNLVKKSVPAAKSTDTMTVRLPVSMIEQIKVMAAEDGVTPNSMLQRLLENGMLRESLVDLVRAEKATMAGVQYDRDLLSGVLGDLSEKMDRVMSAVSK